MVPTKAIAVVLIALMCTGLSGYVLQSEHRTVERTTYDYLGDTTSSVQYSAIDDYTEYNPLTNVTGWSGDANVPTTDRATPYLLSPQISGYREGTLTNPSGAPTTNLYNLLDTWDLSEITAQNESIIHIDYPSSQYDQLDPFWFWFKHPNSTVATWYQTSADPVSHPGTGGHYTTFIWDKNEQVFYPAEPSGDYYAKIPNTPGYILASGKVDWCLWIHVYTDANQTQPNPNVDRFPTISYKIPYFEPATYIDGTQFVTVDSGKIGVWNNGQTNGVVNVLMSKNTEIVKDEPAYYFVFDFNNHIVYDSRGNTIRMELQEVGHAPGWYKFTDDDGVEWRTVWTGYSPGGYESLVRMENPDGVQINFGCPLTGTPTLSNPTFSDGQNRDVYYLYAHRYPSGLAYDLSFKDSLGNTFYPTNMHPGYIESPTWYEFTDAKGNHWITINAAIVDSDFNKVRYTIKSETTGQEVTFQVTRGDDSNSFFVYEDWTQHAKISVPSSLPYTYYLASLDFRNGTFTCRGVEPGSLVNTVSYILSDYVYDMNVTGEWDSTVTELNFKSSDSDALQVFVDSTVVALDPLGRLWGNPYVALDYFYPQQTEYSVRLLFNAFVSLGDSITINGQTFPIADGKIQITDSGGKMNEYTLKGMAVDFIHKSDSSVEVLLVFTEQRDATVSLGALNTTEVTNQSSQFGPITSTIGYCISMTGAWYWQAGLYDIKVTSAEEVGLDLDSGIFGLSGSAACLLMIGFMLLFTAILMYGLKYEMGPYDWLVLIVSTVLLLTLAATW